MEQRDVGTIAAAQLLDDYFAQIIAATQEAEERHRGVADTYRSLTLHLMSDGW